MGYDALKALVKLVSSGKNSGIEGLTLWVCVNPLGTAVILCHHQLTATAVAQSAFPL